MEFVKSSGSLDLAQLRRQAFTSTTSTWTMVLATTNSSSFPGQIFTATRCQNQSQRFVRELTASISKVPRTAGPKGRAAKKPQGQ